MNKVIVFLGVTIFSLFSLDTLADSAHYYRSKYAGQEHRQIKTLSAQDIQDLEMGKGWGLAKAAELNGMPGPAHLLEMEKEIGLTEAQVRQIKALYLEMQRQAIAFGLKFIELERKLNLAFANMAIDDHGLKRILTDISETRSKLRYVHLSTHLKTPAILSPEQIRRYNELRGYFSSDSGHKAPHGHDHDMLKRHTN